MRAAILPERAVLHVGGDDARYFLHNLVTSNVETLLPNEARFAALLTPQGKILFDFFVLAVPEDEGGGFLFDAPKALAADLLKRLGFYKLRSKVEVESRPDLAVAVSLDEKPTQEIGFVFADPRHAKLGTRIVLPAADAETALRNAGFSLVSGEEWQALRISLGVPEGGKDFVYGDTFPHEADMDQLEGVDFAKGCFVGQEVVSRIQHKGGAKTRVVPVAYSDSKPLEGVEVKIGEKQAGFFGSAANGRGLAKLRLDRVEDGLKAGESLSAGNIPLTLVKPDWAKFPFPGESA
jgi:folate-binding protein YgfZ